MREGGREGGRGEGGREGGRRRGREAGTSQTADFCVIKDRQTDMAITLSLLRMRARGNTIRLLHWIPSSQNCDLQE